MTEKFLTPTTVEDIVVKSGNDFVPISQVSFEVFEEIYRQFESMHKEQGSVLVGKNYFHWKIKGDHHGKNRNSSRLSQTEKSC